MRRTLLAVMMLVILGTCLRAQTSGAARGPLASVLQSLGSRWTVREQFKPDWDWSGTWTREGNSNVYVAHYANAGRGAVKTADFRATAESYANGILRFRHPQNGTYDIRVRAGERTASGVMSWCMTAGCAVDFDFSGVPATNPNEAKPAQPVASLTGPWVHSADQRTQTPNSRVILIQDRDRVTMTQTYKMDKTSGRWVTLVCQGSILGDDLRMPCAWAPGGNPFGYANFTLRLRVSSDGNHLDGALTSDAGGGQDAHYSRVP